MEFPPAVVAFFDAERHKQQQHVTVGRINGNLRETKRYALAVLDRLADRGVAMDECAARADELVCSSREFVVAVTPWWRRCVPGWWWCP